MSDAKKEELQKRLISIFQQEADEQIELLSSYLLKLQSEQSSESIDELIEVIYRSFHSLKGASRAVGLNTIETLCQKTESVMSKIKQHEIKMLPEHVLIIQQVVDLIQDLLNTGSSIPNTLLDLVSDISLRLKDIENNNVIRKQENSTKLNIESVKKQVLESCTQPESALQEGLDENDQRITDFSVNELDDQKYKSKKDSVIDTEFIDLQNKFQNNTNYSTIRISKKTLDSLLVYSEELSNIHLTMMQRINKLQTILEAYSKWNTHWKSIRHKIRSNTFSAKTLEIKKDSSFKHIQLQDSLLFANQMIEDWERQIHSIRNELKRDKNTFQLQIQDIQSEIKVACMLPCNTLLDTLPKVIRDLSKELGKSIKVDIQGSEIVIDKRILDELREPIIHLLRNCVDHGIEKPELRKQSKKSEQGMISILVKNSSSGDIEIVLQDDGAGIDVEKVIEKAVKMGIIASDDALSNNRDAALTWIFNSGLSTSTMISDLSGRGLGLAIVREKIERLGGTISVTSENGLGTTFILNIPAIHMAYRGIIVRSHDRYFVFAISNVNQTYRIKRNEIKSVENRNTFTLKDHVLPIIPIHAVLDFHHPREDMLNHTEFTSVIDLEFNNQRILIQVDEVIGEQEVIAKTLGTQLKHVKNIEGTAILGAGDIAPVINAKEFIFNAIQIWEHHRNSTATSAKNAVKKNILVIDDSITSRTLLKTILESSGFIVETAVDGLDAYSKLKQKEFDLVVSDVDMPNLDGFGLTSKIRSDHSLHQTPVVLVTSLSSPQDRERGAHVGANAYIVKSSFDQSNLLDVIGQLI